MLLKKLMEDKQLDFNQPFLTVRRFPPILGSEKVKKKSYNSRPSVTVLPSYKSELKSGPLSNPCTVPFTWEKSPGRPKDESQSQILDHPYIIPKLPPGRIPEIKKVNSGISGCETGKTPSSTLSSSSGEENVTKFEKEGHELGDGDDAYLDALDTLSRAESSFLNCSLSGLSGLDGPEVKLSGTFSTDAQTRDFMMGRFLPAAKAMTSEMPQYGLWKQPAVKEQTRQLREVTSRDKRPPLNRSRLNNVIPHFPQNYEEEESADEDEYDEYDEPGNLSTKVCGLLPRFCLRSSLCLLNPVPGMSVRTQVPMSSVKRAQVTYSPTGSFQETKNERMRVANNEQRLKGGHQKTEMGGYRNMTRNKYNQAQKLEGSSLYRRLQGSGISPQQDGLPKSRFYDETGFTDLPKKKQMDERNPQKRSLSTFRDLLADQSTKGVIDSASPMVEKTLYVDSVHKVVSPQFKVLEETPSVDSLLTNIEKSDILDKEVILQVNTSNPADCSPISLSGKLDQEMGMEILKGFGQDQDLCRESIASANLKLSRNGNMDYEDQQLMKVEEVKHSQDIQLQFPVPPPLPKSPSESWLWRTLPSMSTRNSSLSSFLGTKMGFPHHALRTPSVVENGKILLKPQRT